MCKITCIRKKKMLHEAQLAFTEIDVQCLLDSLRTATTLIARLASTIDATSSESRDSRKSASDRSLSRATASNMMLPALEEKLRPVFAVRHSVRAASGC